MKIEMGESLMESWLRHVICCQIVETNWKVDNSQINNNNISNDLLEKAQVVGYFCKKNKQPMTLTDVIKTAECDVIGIKFDPEGRREIHAVDIAFHSNGLGYGNSETNIKKIVEKSLRTAMCIYGCLHIQENEPVKIYFVSPIKKKTELDRSTKILDKILDGIKKEGLSFDVIANEEFYQRVVSRVLEKSKVVKNTNELFLRSCQLLSVCHNMTNSNENLESCDGYLRSLGEDETTVEEMKVGMLANTKFRKILGAMNKQEIEKFANGKRLHNIPLIVTNRDSKRRCYYKDPVNEKGDEKYYLCNDWKKKDMPKLLKWINQNQTK